MLSSVTDMAATCLGLKSQAPAGQFLLHLPCVHSYALQDVRGRQGVPVPVDVPTLCCEPALTFTGGWQAVLTPCPRNGWTTCSCQRAEALVWLAPSACRQPLVWPLAASRTVEGVVQGRPSLQEQGPRTRSPWFLGNGERRKLRGLRS